MRHLLIRLALLRGVGLLIVAVPVVGATAAISYRAARWSGNSDAARSVAGDTSRPDEEREAAMVGAHRDARATIELLERLADESGSLGEQARNLLRTLGR